MEDSRGDPEGRRVWRHRAQQLDHAERVAASLAYLLRRIEDPLVDDATSLQKSIADSQRVALERSGGRIESRRRFRRSSSGGNPVREGRPLNWLFVDESGDDRPARGVNRDAWFALGAVALTLTDARNYEESANRLKTSFFGDPDITFHEPDMRNHDNRFNLAGDRARQREFCQAVDDLVQQTNFVAFAVGIRKKGYRAVSAGPPGDPYLPTNVYHAAIQLLLERYVDYLWQHDDDPRGRVTIEAQGSLENAEHQRAYVDLLLDGTQWVPERAFRAYLETGVRFRPKTGSSPLEISDMLARDVFEWTRSDCAIPPRRWDVWNDKFYTRGDLQMGKFGLKIFPALDIEHRIQAHRKLVQERKRRP